ncbi:MAG: acyltransferase [Lachnospiraceae bacterium]|nr:acyltransferase [Lachnospiraceae bacterium]
MKTEERKIYLDVLKIMACWLVIYNHLPAYNHYMYGTQHQIPYMVSSLITRINVPLFFMASGALLLAKQDNMASVCKKRILKIVLALIIFSGAYYVIGAVKGSAEAGNIEIHPWKFVASVLRGNLVGAYWYLYAYLGFLMMLPLIQRGVTALSKHEFLIIFLTHFVLNTAIPIANIFIAIVFKGETDPITLSSSFSLPFATIKAFFYPITGYYIDNAIRIEGLKRRHFALMAVCASFCIAASCACTLYEGRATGIFTQNYVQLFDYVLAIIVFIVVKWITQIINASRTKRIWDVIFLVASLTFGIYLLDLILGSILYDRFYYIMIMRAHLTVFTSCALWCFFSMLLGGLITWLIKKTPAARLL